MLTARTAALCRGDRPRPGAARRSTPAHLERLGHGRLRLWRHAVQRHGRGGHRRPTQAAAETLARTAGRGRLGAARPLRGGADPAGGGGAAGQGRARCRWPSPMSPTIPAAAGAATPCGSWRPSTPPASRAAWSASSTTRCWRRRRTRLGVGARFTARFNRPQGTLTADDAFSRPLRGRGRGGGAVRRPRHAAGAASIAGTAMTLGADRGAAARRHHRRGGLDPHAMRRPGVLRASRPRHRRGALRGGEVARAFPRRLRRVLPPRPDRRGGCARPDPPDPVPLRLDEAAAPGAADRRDAQAGAPEAA